MFLAGGLLVALIVLTGQPLSLDWAVVGGVLLLLGLISATTTDGGGLLRALRTPVIRQREEFYTRNAGTSFQTYSSLPPEQAATLLIALLRRHHYTVRRQPHGDALFVLAERHRLSPLSTPLTHLSAVGVVVAVLATLLVQQSATTPPLGMGATATLIPHTALRVRLDGAALQPILGPQPVGLTLYQPHQRARHLTLQPNTPLLLDDHTVSIGVPPLALRVVMQDLTTATPLPTPPRLATLPDPAGLTEIARAIWPSTSANTLTVPVPYQRLRIRLSYSGQGAQGTPDFWGLLSITLLHDDSGGTVNTVLSTPVRQVSLHGHIYNLAGLQLNGSTSDTRVPLHRAILLFLFQPMVALVVHDNATGHLLDVSLIVLALGLALGSYFPHRRLWAKVRTDSPGCAVFLCGQSAHRNADFARAFAHLSRTLRQSLAPVPALPTADYPRPAE